MRGRVRYSTYDLEDCLKAGFLTPAAILSTPTDVLDQVARKVAEQLERPFSAAEVLDVFVDIFEGISLRQDVADLDLVRFVERYRASHELSSNGHLRTQLSSQLIGEAIDAVEVNENEKYPMLSKATLGPVAHAKVEVLKQYTYLTTIFSSRVSIPEFRGYEVVKSIFDALSGPRGHLLMPDDVRSLHLSFKDDFDVQMRIVCDFVAGMTDRYAMEFFGRLHSETAQSMFKPV
jgi:dGTPase